GLAGAIRLGAIIAKGDVMDWPSGSHASTFGGNPVSCRAALATLGLLEREYVANAAARGEQLRKGLRQLQKEFGVVGEIRGLGLMMAMDLVDEGGRANSALREALVQDAFHQGLL